jgi:dipeptidase E
MFTTFVAKKSKKKQIMTQTVLKKTAVSIIVVIALLTGFACCDETEKTNPRNLFLAAYFADVADLLPNFAGEDVSGKTVVFISTAGNVEDDRSYIDIDKDALEELGLIIDELDVETAEKTEISKKLADADYIYVEGGNTFFLLQELRNSGTDKLLIEQINKGKLYIGCSAGSIIASKDIEYVQYLDKNLGPKLNGDYSALNVVDFYPVPHYGDYPFKDGSRSIDSAYSSELPLIRINNSQVITVKGEKIRTLTIVPHNTKFPFKEEDAE